MFKVPGIEEVIDVAKNLGIHLERDEAALYQKHLIKQMEQVDSFVQSNIEE